MQHYAKILRLAENINISAEIVMHADVVNMSLRLAADQGARSVDMFNGASHMTTGGISEASKRS